MARCALKESLCVTVSIAFEAELLHVLPVSLYILDCRRVTGGTRAVYRMEPGLMTKGHGKNVDNDGIIG